MTLPLQRLLLCLLTTASIPARLHIPTISVPYAHPSSTANSYLLKEQAFHLFLTPQAAWSFTYFLPLLYGILIFSLVIFLVNLVANDELSSTKWKNFNLFLNKGNSLTKLYLTPLLLAFLLNLFWTGATTYLWFNHLAFTPLIWKFFFLINFKFLVFLLILISTSFYSSQESFDYVIVIYQFFLWILGLYLTTNFFTLVFFFELLATLVNLLLISSSFSSLYFYNLNSFYRTSYFQKMTPNTFLQTVIFFFWISLLSALIIFFFLLIFYIHFVTLDWFFLEVLFAFFLKKATAKMLVLSLLIWSNFVLALFLKSGLAPLFLWKPTFFKGIPLISLFFYVTVYYYFLLIYFLFVFLLYLPDLLAFHALFNFTILLAGIALMVVIVLESSYLKAFIAISSILNTLLLLLAVSTLSTLDAALLL